MKVKVIERLGLMVFFIGLTGNAVSKLQALQVTTPELGLEFLEMAQDWWILAMLGAIIYVISALGKEK